MEKEGAIDASFAIVLATAGAFSAVDARTSRGIRDAGGRSRLLVGALFAGMAAACLLFCQGIITLAVLFMAAWAVSQAGYALYGGLTRRNFLVANTGTLCFLLATGLVFYSYLIVRCLVGGMDVTQATAPGIMRNLLLTASLWLSCIFMTALGRMLRNLPPASPRVDRTLRPLSVFLLFALANEMLDALPLPFISWFDLMPALQLGGTLLLTLFCAVFSVGTSQLGSEALRESESIDLERRRREQETQMRLYRLRTETDPLTGLATRRKGQALLERLQREQAPYVLAFIDVNGLKRFNDAHGHAAGDRYLAAFASALAKAAGPATAARWGGDEFVVVSEGEGRQALAARIGSIAAVTETREGTEPVLFSYGIAASDEGTGFDDVLSLADARMYQGKREAQAAEQQGRDPAAAQRREAGTL